MEKVRLGRTGLMVSRIGFGGIPIQRLSEDEAVAVVKRCLELGVTFIDTANAYTTSEGRIGKAIAGRRRQDLIIATKSGARNKEGVEQHLALSLNRLGVDYIDLYQFHNISDTRNLDMVLGPKGPWGVVEEALRKGVIRHIGVTCHSMDAAKEAVRTDRFETLMFPFNFITREPEDELLPLCQEHDVGFIAMKPLNGGLLESATIPFKYLLQFPEVVPLVGIEKQWEIEEIAGLLDRSTRLTATEKRQMRRLRDELGTRFCRRCDYCRPCAVEIPISTVMVSASFARRMPPQNLFTGWLAAALEKAKECTECGDCELRCPYKLPIREMMKERAQWYEQAKAEHRKKTGAA